jgi:hypothetical protein
MIKKLLIGTAILAMTGIAGCVVVPPRVAYVGPAVVAPAPVVVFNPFFGWWGGYGYGYHYGGYYHHGYYR